MDKLKLGDPGVFSCLCFQCDEYFLKEQSRKGAIWECLYADEDEQREAFMCDDCRRKESVVVKLDDIKIYCYECPECEEEWFIKQTVRDYIKNFNLDHTISLGSEEVDTRWKMTCEECRNKLRETRPKFAAVEKLERTD